MSEATGADQARTNGHRAGPNGAAPGRAAGLGDAARAGGDGARRLAGGVVGTSRRAAGGALGYAAKRARRALTADLDDRDPDYIRENLPLSWLMATLWYRAEVRNMGNVPERRAGAAGRQPHRRQHVPRGDRPAARLLDLLRRRAALLPARPQPRARLAVRALSAPLRQRWPPRTGTPRTALGAGAAVLVFPGGDWEVHRPSWEGNQVDLAGRKGFIKLALNADVPIVPVVDDRRPGDGAVPEPRRLAGEADWAPTATCGSRCCRSRSSLPWILNVGDLLGHLPLPAKITIEVAASRSTCASSSAPSPTSTRSTTYVTRVMQETLDGARRRAPLPGRRLMRLNESIVVSASPKLIWDYIAEPANALHFMSGITRWEVEGEQRTGLGARYRMLMRVGSAEMGGLVEVVEFSEPPTWPGHRSPGSTSAGAGGCGAPAAAAPGSRCASPTASPAPGSPGTSPSGSPRRRSARHLRRSLQQLKRQVEHEQLRRDAAARKAEREAASA